MPARNLRRSDCGCQVGVASSVAYMLPVVRQNAASKQAETEAKYLTDLPQAPPSSGRQACCWQRCWQRRPGAAC